MKRSGTIQAWQLLLAVNRAGNLSEGALLAGLGLPAASRLVSELEKELAVELLDRRARPAVPTQAFKALVPAARRIVRAHRDAMELAAGLALSETGALRTVRISLPINIGRQLLLNALLGYEDRTEGVTLDISSDGSLKDLVEGKVDIAVFGDTPRTGEVFAKPLGQQWTFLMCTKAYEKRFGLPSTIGELRHHKLLMRGRSNDAYSRQLSCGAQSCVITDDWNLQFADAEGCRTLLLAGSGIACDLDVGYVAEDLARGDVFAVLPGWHRPAWSTCICCRTHASQDPVIRSLMALIEKNLFHSFMDRWQFWYRKLGIPLASLQSSPQATFNTD